VGQARDRRRKGLAGGRRRRLVGPRLELVEELQDAGAALGRRVEPDVEVGDPAEPHATAELVADERHRPAERGERRGALLGLADDAHPDAGVREVRRGLDVGDRHEPYPGVGDLAGEDRADLLAEQLVDALGALAHRVASGRPGRADGSGRPLRRASG
jgi:hypothetical protein